LADQDDHDAVVAFISHRLDEAMITAGARANLAQEPWSSVAAGREQRPWDEPRGGRVEKAEAKRATRKAEAIRKAKQGDPNDLIRLVTPKKNGRPTGSKMSEAKRAARYPIHRAVRMVPMAEHILRDMYPDQPKKEVHDCALLVVEYFLDRSVTVSQLTHHIARSKKNRRRIQSS
jgi:hypothetical protein